MLDLGSEDRHTADGAELPGAFTSEDLAINREVSQPQGEYGSSDGE